MRARKAAWRQRSSPSTAALNMSSAWSSMRASHRSSRAQAFSIPDLWPPRRYSADALRHGTGDHRRRQAVLSVDGVAGICLSVYRYCDGDPEVMAMEFARQISAPMIVTGSIGNDARLNFVKAMSPGAVPSARRSLTTASATTITFPTSWICCLKSSNSKNTRQKHWNLKLRLLSKLSPTTARLYIAGSRCTAARSAPAHV